MRKAWAALTGGGAALRPRRGGGTRARRRQAGAVAAAAGAQASPHHGYRLVAHGVPAAGADGPAVLLAEDMVVQPRQRPGAVPRGCWVEIGAAGGSVAVLREAGGHRHPPPGGLARRRGRRGGPREAHKASGGRGSPGGRRRAHGGPPRRRPRVSAREDTGCTQRASATGWAPWASASCRARGGAGGGHRQARQTRRGPRTCGALGTARGGSGASQCCLPPAGCACGAAMMPPRGGFRTWPLGKADHTGPGMLQSPQELLEKGRLEERVRVIERLLREGLDWAAIERVMGVNETQFQALKQQVEARSA